MGRNKISLKEVWSRRYEQINAFEHVHENHTHILKFYLHISKEEQLTRFAERLDDRPSNGRSRPTTNGSATSRWPGSSSSTSTGWA